MYQIDSDEAGKFLLSLAVVAALLVGAVAVASHKKCYWAEHNSVRFCLTPEELEQRNKATVEQWAGFCHATGCDEWLGQGRPNCGMFRYQDDDLVVYDVSFCEQAWMDEDKDRKKSQEDQDIRRKYGSKR